jgi:hypothetical protein
VRSRGVTELQPHAFDVTPTRRVWAARGQCTSSDVLLLRVGDGPAIPVSKGDPAQISVALAKRFPVWVERSDRVRVYAGNRTLLSEDATYNTAVAVNDEGPNALVVWWEAQGETCARSLHGAIVSPEGGVLRKFLISNDVLGHQKAAIAWNGSEYAVIWERATSNQLLGATFDASGNLIVSPVPVTASRERGNYVNAVMISPAIAWNGAHFVLVWQRLYSTYIPMFPDAPAEYDVRRQYQTAQLSLQGIAEVLDPRGIEPTSTIGPDRGLIARRRDDGQAVAQMRIVTRATGASVVQREVSSGDGPLLSAAFGDEFVFIAGTEVYSVTRNGSTTAQEPLPPGAVANDIRVNGNEVAIAYVLNDRAYVRTIELEVKTGRRRSVGR